MTDAVFVVTSGTLSHDFNHRSIYRSIGQDRAPPATPDDLRKIEQVTLFSTRRYLETGLGSVDGNAGGVIS